MRKHFENLILRTSELIGTGGEAEEEIQEVGRNLGFATKIRSEGEEVEEQLVRRSMELRRLAKDISSGLQSELQTQNARIAETGRAKEPKEK